MIKGGDTLTDISHFEAKCDKKNRFKHFSQPGEAKIIRMHM